jgi:hypothetical protein
MMTHLLERFPAGLFDVTLFEATPRVGGKVLTQRFGTIPAIYEAGVAELYDYSHIGLDPLKTLLQELGLKAVPMHGHAVVLGDEILRTEHDFRRRFGLPTFRALNEFHRPAQRPIRVRIIMRAMSRSTASTHGRIGRFAKYSTTASRMMI